MDKMKPWAVTAPPQAPKYKIFQQFPAGNFLFSHHPNRISLKLRKKFALLYFCETTFGFTIR